MPESCSAWGCSNRRTIQTKSRGITFHKFPKDPVKRKVWVKAVRRKDFEPSDFTILCSCHFEEKHMDRTGQTVRLREGAVPSVFNFPKKPRRSQRNLPESSKEHEQKSSSTKVKSSRKLLLPEEPVSLELQTTPAAGTQKARKSIRGTARADVNINPALETVAREPLLTPTENPSAVVADHHYAIDPDNVKQKLAEAQARVEELQRQLRNARDRERRKDAVVRALLVELKKQNMLTQELLDCSELWVLCDACDIND